METRPASPSTRTLRHAQHQASSLLGIEATVPPQAVHS